MDDDTTSTTATQLTHNSMFHISFKAQTSWYTAYHQHPNYTRQIQYNYRISNVTQYTVYTNTSHYAQYWDTQLLRLHQ